MAVSNKDLSVLRQAFVSQLEAGSNNTFPVYRAPINKTAYVKKIIITNNTANSGTFDIGLYENSFVQGGNIFVAVLRDTNVVATSTDGINWISRNLPSNTAWNSVAYGNGIFVAIANGNNNSSSATSIDGTTWTSRNLPSPGSSGAWFNIVYGNGIFVSAVDSLNPGSLSTVAASSTDGITWNTITNFGNGFAFRARNMAYGNGTFLLVEGINTSTTAATSTDGITWTRRTLSSSSVWTAAAFGNGVFVVLSSQTTAYSTDGILWATGSLPTSGTWTGVTYGNGTFVAVSFNSVNAATSPDGITWTLRTLPATRNWSFIAFGNGVFNVVSTGSTFSAYSTDGITWATSNTLNSPVASSGTALAYPQRSDFSNDNYLYRSVTLAANTTNSLQYEVIVPPTHEIRVRSSVPMQVTIMGEV